jgi:hypothetical protein
MLNKDIMDCTAAGTSIIGLPESALFTFRLDLHLRRRRFA